MKAFRAKFNSEQEIVSSCRFSFRIVHSSSKTRHESSRCRSVTLDESQYFAITMHSVMLLPAYSRKLAFPPLRDVFCSCLDIIFIPSMKVFGSRSNSGFPTTDTPLRRKTSICLSTLCAFFAPSFSMCFEDTQRLNISIALSLSFGKLS